MKLITIGLPIIEIEMKSSRHAEMADLEPHWTEVIAYSIAKKGTCRYKVPKIHQPKMSFKYAVN